MTRREILESLGHRELAEDPELHLAVAHHVRIRGDALAVAREQVIDDPVAILLGEAENAELHSEEVTDGARVADVLLPRTVARQSFLVRPVFHVGANDLVPLLKQERRRHTGVHATGHRRQDFCHPGF